MGSIEAACIAGFLCRLCSEMHRTVIHIYGDQGQSRGLAGKINAYLPVTVRIAFAIDHEQCHPPIKHSIVFVLFLKSKCHCFVSDQTKR